MRRRTTRGLFPALLATAFLAFVTPACAQNALPIGVTPGAWVVYGTSSTGAFIPFDREFRVTVTSVDYEAAEARGTVLYNTSLDQFTAPFTNAPEGQYLANVSLVPFVVRNDSWDVGPWQQVQSTWQGNAVQQESYYNDILRVVVNYTLRGVATTNEDGDPIVSNVTYVWDVETGILCEMRYEVENLNFDILSGTVTWQLKDTSAWQLTTGEVEGPQPQWVFVALAAGAALLSARHSRKEVRDAA
ncbi:MAG: hypothetical protein Kow0069_36990 [Promethearchaeota archaeon]